jgi:transposase
MAVLYACCCGIEVHAQRLGAWLLKRGKKEGRTFSTRTADWRPRLAWLRPEGCTHVASESTGVEWRPGFNILDGALAVSLTNARDAKGDKARTTDGRDAEWLADLLRHGRLKPSFLPPRPIRGLREVTRSRESLVGEQTALANRSQELSESATLKLGQGARAALGGSGKVMVRALAAGEPEAEKRSHLAQTSRKRKPPQVPQALEGRRTQAPRGILGQLLDPYAPVAAALHRAAGRSRQEVDRRAAPCVPAAGQLLDPIPGVGETGAQVSVAELGVDMERFPPVKHFASGAGRCPGDNERAGKRKRGKTPPGSRSLRAALVQAAWAATQQKGTDLAAQYKRLGSRRGKKKALVAVGHSSLGMVYSILQDRTSYQELGGEYFDRRNVDKQRKRLIRQSEALGGKVTVEESKEAA